MGIILKFLLCIYLFSLIISLLIGTLRFFVDVARWHDREEKVKIEPSADDDLKDFETAVFVEKESEVIQNDNDGQRDSSAVLRFGCKS